MSGLYKHSCPVCGKELNYKTKQSLYQARWRNSCCSKQCRKKHTPAKIYRRNCPSCNKVIEYKTYNGWRNSAINNRLCHSCRNSGERNPFHGKIHTDSIRLKKRLSAIEQMNVKSPMFNKRACSYFDELNNTMGWNGQHALNGGEIQLAGYFVDFYDKERNLVVEYDEPHHEKPSVKKKDLVKQRDIIKQTNCQFFRYSEKYDTLYEVTINE